MRFGKSDRESIEKDPFCQETIEAELPEGLKMALQAIQHKDACTHRVPILEIKDNRRYYYIVPRQRLRAISNKIFRHGFEKWLLFLAGKH